MPAPSPRGLLAAGGAPMGQVLEGGDGLADEAVARSPVEVGHQGDAAGVVLEAGVVEAGRWAAGAPCGTGPRATGTRVAGVVGSAVGCRCTSRHRVAPEEKWISHRGTTLALAWSDNSTRSSPATSTPAPAGHQVRDRRPRPP